MSETVRVEVDRTIRQTLIVEIPRIALPVDDLDAEDVIEMIAVALIEDADNGKRLLPQSNPEIMARVPDKARTNGLDADKVAIVSTSFETTDDFVSVLDRGF